jgi:hypothetical protein
LQVYIKDDDQNKNKLGIGNLKKDREPENKGRAQIRNRLRSPGIDSKESIPPAYVAWRADIRQPYIGWLGGSLNAYKFGLRKKVSKIQTLLRTEEIETGKAKAREIIHNTESRKQEFENPL